MSKLQLKEFVVGAFVALVFCSLTPAQTRTPWTTSRIEGSPDPAKAFVSEAVLPGLKFNEAVDMVPVPGRSRFLLLERKGKVLSFPASGDVAAAEEVMDLLGAYPTLYHALGFALHPKFPDVRQAFICYAVPRGDANDVKIARFTFSSVDPLRLDPASEEIVLGWRASGHHGGHVMFGPDGYLYITAGDGGPAAPPDSHKTGQDLSDFRSSILRVDVDQRGAGKNYRVPSDNPWFAGGPTAAVGAAASQAVTALPEIWAFGLRNPWKISFDSANGNLWCGDVGWEVWEMVYLIKRGGNYGWSAFEGPLPLKPEQAHPVIPITPPIIAYPRADGASVTGGYVYHGRRLPELAGAYIFGDWESGKIWALRYADGQIVRHEEIADTDHKIITFARDSENELYYVDYGAAGGIHRLARNPQAASRVPFPRRLSETGLFSDMATQRPASGVQPFSIAHPLWEDGARAQRLIGLPGTSMVTTSVKVTPELRSHIPKAEFTTRWPANAVLARTLGLGQLATTEAERIRPVETQILHYNGTEWRGYTYRWNDDGTDADLVPPEGAERKIQAAADPHALGPSTRTYTWRFQSRAECLRCHTTWSGAALGFNPLQLRGVAGTQASDLVARGVVDSNFFERTRLALETGDAVSARAVLHANCAHCHREHGGGAVAALFNFELLTAQMNSVDVSPSQGGFGLEHPKLIDPGNPWNSVIAVRMAKAGAGHMPAIGARETDVQGLKTIEDWIARMAPGHPAPKPWTPVNWDRAMIERELATVSGAMRARRAIDDGAMDADLRAFAFEIAWASPESTVRDLYERFKPEARRERTLGFEVDLAAVLALRGDAERGARLISTGGKLASCQACHFIQGQGRHFGPDLSLIGARMNPAEILESIALPAKVVTPAFRTTVVELRDGTVHGGLVSARDSARVSLVIASGQTLVLSRVDIRAERSEPGSLMPAGQLQGLTAQEAADLVAHLARLR